MKKKEFIEISATIDNKVIKTLLSVKELRKFLAKGESATVKIFEDGKNAYSIKLDLKDIEYLLNQYDYKNCSFIPTFLSKYLIDFTTVVANTNLLPTIGRESEINKSFFYLSQDIKNNVFLVGDIDCGKTKIAQEIIKRIVTSECPSSFYGKRVISINFEEILDIKSNFKLDNVVNKIINYIEKYKKYVIIYVDDALYLKMDEHLIKILHYVIKNDIQAIFCCRAEEYEKLYMEDYFIKKYENIIFIDEPEYKEIYPIIENHINAIMDEYNVTIPINISKFAIYTSSLLNSHSCNPGRSIDILIKAAKYAKIQGKQKVDKECILNCYDSQYKLFNAMSESEKRKIAYHEAGHFLTLLKSNNSEAEKTACISILPTMNFLGINICYYVPEKSLNMDKKNMVDRIAIYLGGRVAEKEITNVFSSGASSDLEAANTLAEDMLMQYGLSDGDNKNRSFIVDGCYIKSYLLTENDKKRINREIKSIIKKAYKKAETIIKENRQLLDLIAETLLKEIIITGEDMEAIIEKFNNSK